MASGRVLRDPERRRPRQPTGRPGAGNWRARSPPMNPKITPGEPSGGETNKRQRLSRTEHNRLSDLRAKRLAVENHVRAVAFDADLVRLLEVDAAQLEAVEFIQDHERHGNPHLSLGQARAPEVAALVPPALPDGGADPGLFLAASKAGDAALRADPEAVTAFITALGAHRSFARELDPPLV
mgnify:CR=1 FL=1